MQSQKSCKIDLSRLHFVEKCISLLKKRCFAAQISPILHLWRIFSFNKPNFNKKENELFDLARTKIKCILSKNETCKYYRTRDLYG